MLDKQAMDFITGEENDEFRKLNVLCIFALTSDYLLHYTPNKPSFSLKKNNVSPEPNAI